MIRLFSSLVLVGALGLAQAPPLTTPAGQGQTAAPATYILGPNDQLTVSVADLDDFTDKTFRIDMRGDVTLPLIGRLHAASLTVGELETQAAERLKHILKNPDVVISIASFGSQPVSILGAVSNPGIRQLEGQKTLYEVLSMAGGLRADAGNTVQITRDLKFGSLPLADAQDDESGRFSVASIKVKTIMKGTDPGQNILVKPGDVISIPKADMVYAIGCVNKPGGFLLTENSSISTLQVISLAEGLQRTAAMDRAKILREVPGSSQRTEIAINLKQLMAGKTNDVPLQANDILFIPNSGAKSAGFKTLDVIVGSAGTAAIYAGR